MPNYRVYCLDGDGGIGLAEWIQAETDEDALAEARRLMAGGQRCEVWGRDGMVATLFGDNGNGRGAAAAR